MQGKSRGEDLQGSEALLILGVGIRSLVQEPQDHRVTAIGRCHMPAGPLHPIFQSHSFIRPQKATGIAHVHPCQNISGAKR